MVAMTVRICQMRLGSLPLWVTPGLVSVANSGFCWNSSCRNCWMAVSSSGWFWGMRICSSVMSFVSIRGGCLGFLWIVRH